MPSSVAQAIAQGIITKLGQNQSPLVLEPQEFAVVADILNSFTGALASAAHITVNPIPTTQLLSGNLTLNDVQSRMLKAMLIEFVRVPADSA